MNPKSRLTKITRLCLPCILLMTSSCSSENPEQDREYLQALREAQETVYITDTVYVETPALIPEGATPHITFPKQNFIYKAVDNPITVSVPGMADEDVRLSISNGSISKSAADGYIVRARSGNRCTISVTGVDADGSTLMLGSFEYRVKAIPDPVPYFAGKGRHDQRVKKSHLSAAQGILARMENFEYDAKFTVTAFDLTIVSGGDMKDYSANGNRLSGEMKTALKKVKLGDTVLVSGIKCKGPDGTVRNLGTLQLKVI